MSLFDYPDQDALGSVLSVDTGMVVVRVADIERLRQLQVNRLVVLRSSRAGQHLVGIIQKITRSISERRIAAIEPDDADDQEIGADQPSEINLVRIALIGTFVDRHRGATNVFLRTLETVPEIDADCFSVENEKLTGFMQAVARIAKDGQRLLLGKYTLDEKADAYLNGNKFFQRHAAIVGSTGSGKSWATATLLEQAADLPNSNAIVFDIHGEYGPLQGPGFRHLRVAGPGDLGDTSLADGVLFLPYWLLGYEALVSMLVDRSDQNAPNQAMVVQRAIVKAKQAYISGLGRADLLDNFTIDSPIPFDIDAVLGELERLNTEMVPGAKTEKQGDFHGKLSRLIARLESKRSDRRLGFMFQGGSDTMRFEWLQEMAAALVAGRADLPGQTGGVKIIDFSEVPSDILPLIISLVARLTFSIQQWMLADRRHPVALFCDEAHLYIPDRAQTDAASEIAIQIFERIAKEGRKYGVGLVVISQRPSEVNRTILSQCNNLVAMRLTNGDDQGVIKRLLPDSLGGFGDLLPVLDTGEALVVGDASLLPSRIRIAEPTNRPASGTIEFWDRWGAVEGGGSNVVQEAVDGWRNQTLRV
ncbi:ATP-binding protein [Nitrospirillum pindoramense]|uniref:Helicase HerA central domain-containing protein n=1 Tax=Nitrospirillum amazonense TaxID=28077 RepID=A0A560H8F5_9PROT|nr:ATP-binding protein [Nitrospirillum amazonense]TWB42615.1 hypothetical protein FBZ90_106215 [Nitrospirillum amazonense]